jgi:very-short-patch-repair endonuclease
MNAGERNVVHGVSKEAKDRLRRVFLFLKERAKLDSPVERTIDREAWQLRLSDLPSHPAVSGALVEDPDDAGEEKSDVVLEVRRPTELPCPAPGPTIKSWLPAGWDKVDSEVQPINALALDNLQVELFDDDPRRGTSFLLWRNLRDEWKKNEVPNRRVIATYEHLFALRARLLRESERYRVLLGDGWLVFDHEEGRIAHPVLLQELELEFDERAPALRLRIADPIPELNTALLRLLPEVESASIGEARELVEQRASTLVDAAAVRELVGKVANLLFPNAKVVDDLEQAEADRPTFACAPIMFLGTWSGTIQTAADRFIDALDQMEELPLPLVDVVMDQPHDPHLDTWDVEPLFTLPANREQEEILRRLERNGSVVVQGPPGTGKTHTIANLIGHLLAEGKTVLVTSHTAKALRVVRDKVVPELQPLCVAYLESDLRGREQLESSVNGIVARLSLPGADEKAIARAAEHREVLSEELTEAEQTLDRALASEVEPIVAMERSFLPREAAERVRQSTNWIPGPIELGAALPLTVAEVHDLYRLQESFPASDEAELEPGLPAPEVIVEPDTYSDLVRKLKALESNRLADQIAIYCNSSVVAADLAQVVERAFGAVEWLTSEDWLDRCLEDVSRGGSFLSAWDELRTLIGETLDAHEAWHPLKLRHEIVLPEIEPQTGVQTGKEILEHLASGGGLGFFARLGRGHWEPLIERARIDGKPPATADDFSAIQAGYRLNVREQKLRKRWSKQMVPLGVPALPESVDEWPSFLEPFEQKIARAKLWWSGEWSGIEEELASYGVTAALIDSRLTEDERKSVSRRAKHALHKIVLPGLEALQRRERLASLLVWERRLLDRLVRSRQSAAGRALADAARERDVERYAAAYERLMHLSEQRVARAKRKRLLDRLHPVAPGWVAALESRAPPHDRGRPPGDVEEGWLVAQLAASLEARAKVDLDELQRRVVELRDRLHRETAALVASRAWAKQVERTSPTARRNLTGWLDYQKQIGKGTGKRAPLLQRKALELLAECKDSVPVWIMPLSKVIESYDLARTRFDVVIIDEASQCDVNGLFAFGLAKQIVVVGDDQQVSPLAVGQKLEPIQSLIDLHLDGIPNKELYTGRLSIYDLARQSQTAIRLREHFRCVPEIISFSSRLAYDGEIQALRESASAIVRPPVIEHRVAGICDEHNLNMPESIEVAALVAACIEQPEYEDATMGVISLLGDEQWSQIERFLHAWLEPQEIEKRRLLCGAPAHFQGDERDVIFVSMVWGPTGTPLAMNDNPEFKKRLNVAASRARDQMWVVTSLNADADLKPNDLRRKLIDHARNPGALLAKHEGRAESDLERRILERLRDRGFRVKPQWEVGAYRLDLVVEGNHGRVAIECDGDRQHAELERSQDRSRRQQLERLGWRFIRVRGSQFALDPDKTIDAVTKRLGELEIDPIGHDDGDDASSAEALRDRVTNRAAELRQAIWDRLCEQETIDRTRRAKKSGKPKSVPKTKGPDLRRSRTTVCRELQMLDPRFHDPRCGQCSGAARLEITDEGIVTACMDAFCGEHERVDLETLQRLADHLEVVCLACGGAVTSRAKNFGHFLRCKGWCPNTTWSAVNERLEGERGSTSQESAS